jgi:hypothetical protein
MSELQLKPELEGSSGSQLSDGRAPADQAVAIAAVRSGVDGRAARRRFGSARLRMPTDDGFHLFRVY